MLLAARWVSRVETPHPGAAGLPLGLRPKVDAVRDVPPGNDPSVVLAEGDSVDKVLGSLVSDC